MYMHKSLSKSLFKKWPVQGLWPDFGATLKIHNTFNFDRNQLKLSTQQISANKFRLELNFWWPYACILL